jgi:hypothetical protein
VSGRKNRLLKQKAKNGGGIGEWRLLSEYRIFMATSFVLYIVASPVDILLILLRAGFFKR